MVIILTITIVKEATGKRQRMWAVSLLIPGAYTTCTVMFGNGVGTGTAIIAQRRRLTLRAPLRGLAA